MHGSNKFIFPILISFCIAGIFIYSGCSSSSNSIRYNTPKEEKKEKKSAVRFSSKDDNAQQPETATKSHELDTLDAFTDTSYSDPDEIPEEKNKIDVAQVLKKYSEETAGKNISADASNDREKILMQIIKYLNTPYKFGGHSKYGIDCSAFTQSVYNKALSISLERSARQQYHEGEVVDNKSDLEFGDLVFFNTRRRVKPGHVGIYIGDHLFAHASSSNGVIVSSLNNSYYAQRYMGARRIKDMLGTEKFSGSNNN